MTKAFTVFDPHHLQTVCHVILNVSFGYFILHTCVFYLVICCRASSHTLVGTFISVTRSIFKVFLPVTFAQNLPTRMWMRLSLMFRAHAGVFAGRTESFKRAGFYIECEVELCVCNIGSVIKHDSGTFLFVRSSVWQNRLPPQPPIISVSIIIFPLFGHDYLLSGAFVYFVTVWTA